jgi:hypothetical protein
LEGLTLSTYVRDSRDFTYGAFPAYFIACFISVSPVHISEEANHCADRTGSHRLTTPTLLYRSGGF